MKQLMESEIEEYLAKRRRKMSDPIVFISRNRVKQGIAR